MHTTDNFASSERIGALDHGYVRTVQVLGTDLTIANAARVSYDKASTALSDADVKLINYLVLNHHDSPLRHAAITFEIYAPLEVKNQWIKHMVASTHLDDQNGWNESSRRYVTEDVEFYTPERFSMAPENSKQGAGEYADDKTNAWMLNKLDHMQIIGAMHYEQALNKGIAPEQARLLLPAYGLYVRWQWTASLNAILNFLTLRSGHGAQQEITEYAKAIEYLVFDEFPVTATAYQEHRSN